MQIFDGGPAPSLQYAIRLLLFAASCTGFCFAVRCCVTITLPCNVGCFGYQSIDHIISIIANLVDSTRGPRPPTDNDRSDRPMVMIFSLTPSIAPLSALPFIRAHSAIITANRKHTD